MKKYLTFELDTDAIPGIDLDNFEFCLKVLLGTNGVSITTVYENDEEFRKNKESGWVAKK